VRRTAGAAALLLAVSLPGAPATARAPEKPAAAKAGPGDAEAAVWLPDLAAGRAQALRRRQPILVRGVTVSCPWCRKLEEELQKPAVAAELARWTLVAFDVDRNERDAAALTVSTVPALRLLTPEGRSVTGHDGFLPADELVAWLKKHHDAAAAAPAEELTAVGPPDAAAVGRLVGGLNQRDPTLREAAVRRLLSAPGPAAAPVVEALAKGPLQTRLAALELLRAWQAPVGDLDPWRPETLSADRLKSLRAWAPDAGSRPPAAAASLTAGEREAARRELVRLTAAPEAEATALRERLARHGPALLPDVHGQLKAAATDLARERLTALRYRLAATDALALRWPGGLERLASTAAGPRHQAVQELIQQVTAAEEPLLLELFSNPDPLVRELSLRALHGVAGRRAGSALAGLLRDPDPNVRAAVLKQLAEKPASGMVARVVEYLAGETDTDLVVHAVRVLRSAKGTAAVEPLKKLLKHDSWRVRAEAVEALGEVGLSHHGSSGADVGEVYEAMVEALQDPDGFVAGRAAETLKKSDRPSNIEPLLKAAAAHPELTAEVVSVLSYGSETPKKALPKLREFCRHPDPEVRAKALAGLCDSAPEAPVEELRAALQDKAGVVREAAAGRVFVLLEKGRSAWEEKHRERGNGRVPAVMRSGEGASDLLEAVRQFFTGGSERGPDPDDVLNRVRAGRGRPEGLAELAPLLTPLLNAAAPDERLAAALSLTALAREKEAVPVLVAAAGSDPTLQARATGALHWLPWPQRLALYRQLLALKPKAEPLAAVIQGMARVTDPRAAAPLWELAARPDTPADVAHALVEALSPSGGRGNGRDSGELEPSVRQWLAKEVRPRAESGPEVQRLIALALLANGDPKEAVAVADKLTGDTGLGAPLREDAFRVSLLCRHPVAAARQALATLAGPDAGLRRLAALYLAFGDGTVRVLGEDKIYLSAQHEMLNVLGRRNNMPEPLGPPRGFDPEVARRLLGDPDPMTAAVAGYLLTQAGDPAGFAPLVRFWRENVRDDDGWARLVYRAASALGDDARVPLLEEIYRDMVPADGEAENTGRVKEFYWTIRVLDGTNALRLRKKIRAEVGMAALR
jgi:HEAT repeat protein